MRYAMAIDTKKCVGCSDCVVACQTENAVPIGYCRDWIVEVTDGTYPQLETEIRSERCNHCENAPCVRCCPTGASHYEAGGIVTVTHNDCIGCGACITSCPHLLFAPCPKRAAACLCGSLPYQVHVFWRPGRPQQHRVQRVEKAKIQNADSGSRN